MFMCYYFYPSMNLFDNLPLIQSGCQMKDTFTRVKTNHYIFKDISFGKITRVLCWEDNIDFASIHFMYLTGVWIKSKANEMLFHLQYCLFVNFWRIPLGFLICY